MQKFSERLISLRKEREMTQSDLAKVCKKQRSTVSGYETEGKEPDYELLCSMADYFGVTTDYLLGRDDERAHADVVFRNDNAAFKRHYDELSPELKAVVTSAFDSFYVLLSRCMRDGNLSELLLYRDLMDTLQRDRDAISRLASGDSANLADVFPQLMEKQNSLKASASSIFDSLLQADIAAAKEKH